MMKLKIDPVTLATAGIFLLFIVLAAVFTQPSFENPEVATTSPPLHKNTELQLQDGEVYAYSYTSDTNNLSITYAVSETSSCMIVTIVEADSPAVCLGPDGERYGGPINESYGDPSLLLFKPWMLALNDSWTWNTSIFLAFDNGREHVSDLQYRVVRRELYRGREAFVVELDPGIGEKEYNWVDAEKRITMRILGDGYEVLLLD